MIEWANFSDIWWLAGLPVLLSLLLLIQYRSEKVFHHWFNRNQYGRHHPVARYFLTAGALCLVFAALLGPAWGNASREVNVMGREIYFLLDVSASMNCRDIKPSRLTRAKQELAKVIQALKGDKMGLLVYTSQGFVQCPLTTDSQLLTTLLQIVETRQFSNTGTDLRAGLSRCLERFAAEPRIEGKKVSRAVVVITDGEDFGDKYTSVLLRLENQGVKVIPVAVGTPEGAPVPLDSGSDQYFQETGGKSAYSRVNPETVNAIAAQSGEPAFMLDQSGASLSKLTQHLQNLPATLVDQRTENSASNRYQWFLGLAIALSLISLYLLPVRK